MTDMHSSPNKKYSSNVAMSSTQSNDTHAYEERLKELGLKKVWLSVMKDYELGQQLG